MSEDPQEWSGPQGARTWEQRAGPAVKNRERAHFNFLLGECRGCSWAVLGHGLGSGEMIIVCFKVVNEGTL